MSLMDGELPALLAFSEPTTDVGAALARAHE